MNELSAKDHRVFYRRNFAEQLAVLAKLDFVYMGFFDCTSQCLIDWWAGHGRPEIPEPSPDAIQEISRKIGRLVSLAQQAVSVDPACPEAARLETCSDYLICVGDQKDMLVPVIVGLGDNYDQQIVQGVFMGMGMSYLAQELHTMAAPPPAAQRDDALEKALGMLSVHFAVLDADGTISYSTDLPDDWMRENGNFRIVSRRLFAPTQKAQKQLALALQKATGLDPQPSIISVKSQSGRAKIAVIMPVKRSSPRKALIIFDRGGADPLLRDHLLKLFGLTNSERRITHLLLEGMSLSDITEETNLSMSTVRSYMKAIFAKTNTHRQSELIANFQNAVPQVKYSSGFGRSEISLSM